MKTSHNLIYQHFQQLRDTYPALEGSEDPIPADFNGFCEKFFYNWKPHNHSMRLNPLGFDLFSKIYHYWQYQLPEEGFHFFQNGHVIVGLQRHMTTPYFYNNRHFFVFDQDIALEIEIVGQNLDHWVNSFLKK